MNRRDVIRIAVLSVFGASTQKYDLLAQGLPGGVLSCDLDKWSWLTFRYKGKQVNVPMKDVFDALDDYYGSVKATTPGVEVR